ncbi:uncharacterized protein [Euwallacea similis]|uniref:uncharacterized protein n=1 Tax=Euwallacea similis TaxID=1736056 RepID=UPI003450585D
MKVILLFALVGSISCGLRDYANKIYIGTALSNNHLDNDATYNQLAYTQFNAMTPENQMKIDATEPSQNQFSYTLADELVSFAQEHSMKIRGHTLVWHSQVPSWMSALSGTNLQSAMVNHIENVVGHYKGQLYAWDVVNEIFNEDGSFRDSIWTQAMGQDFVALAFKTAAAADPNAKLYINDYNIEGQNAKSNALYTLVSALKSAGVPIHGVGFQSHFTVGQVPSTLKANLERFTALGLEVAITELDVGENSRSDDIAQAADYATVVETCVSVNGCVGVTIWGITDNYSWRSSTTPLPFDSSGNAKAAVDAMINVLQ